MRNETTQAADWVVLQMESFMEIILLTLSASG